MDISSGLYQPVTKYNFIRIMQQMNRDKFSSEALHLIYDCLVQEAITFDIAKPLDARKVCNDYCEETRSQVIAKYSLNEKIDVNNYIQFNSILAGKYFSKASNDTVYVYLNF